MHTGIRVERVWPRNLHCGAIWFNLAHLSRRRNGVAKTGEVSERLTDSSGTNRDAKRPRRGEGQDARSKEHASSAPSQRNCHGYQRQDNSISGEVSERLKEHAWKVCIRQRIEGSNPSLSANQRSPVNAGLFCARIFQGGSRTRENQSGRFDPSVAREHRRIATMAPKG
jgi:hypothetical protein